MSGPRFTLAQRFQRAVLVGLSRLPVAVQQLLARPPVNSAGDRMAPDMALLMKLSESGKDFSDLPPVEARETTERDLALFAASVPACGVEEEIEIGGGVLATRYSTGTPDRGMILFFHGGGFVIGSRASYTAPARMLAHGTGADVVSVEYRLAPEHPFPVPHEDALAAWRHVVEHARTWGVDPARIVVAGESAGGNIAAVLCQQVRGEDVQPLLQVLIQPVTDLTVHHPSQNEFAESPALSAKQIAWFLGHYLPAAADHRDPRISPLHGELNGLPRAIVSLAGFDPLRDDGLAYATALLEAGVGVGVLEEPGLVHGFISFTAVSRSSKDATNRIAAAVADALAKADRPVTIREES